MLNFDLGKTILIQTSAVQSDVMRDYPLMATEFPNQVQASLDFYLC